LSVVADGLHSGVDAAANLIAIFVLRLAEAPPDEDHPYGHSKYETLAAFVLSGLLVLTAFELARAAVGRLVAPQPPELSALTFATMFVTLAVNLAVALLETRGARRLRSELLAADAAQTRGDIVVSLAVLGGMFLSPVAGGWIDPLLALGVAVFIAWSAYRVFREVLPVLTDRVVYDVVEVARVVESVPGVVSVHDIRSRGPPREAFVQMHLVVDRRDVAGAHAIADEVERRLAEELGVREAFVHIEPEDDDSGPPGTRRAGERASKG
jgi:cation diffusion facilitator family transporter